MKLTYSGAVLLGLLQHVSAAPAGGDAQAQAAGLNFPFPDFFRAAEVHKAFKESWKGYYEHAFPHDNLHPLSNTFDDGRNGWGVTAIDALSTAIVMRDFFTVKQILDFVPKIDFTTTKVANEGISVFETNIRYLGGLISAYDLLSGPYRYLSPDQRKVKPLLDQAKTLADSLSVAFNTTSGVPDPTVFLNPEPRNSGSGRNNIAEIGTLVLEWTRLSDLTGDDKYAKLVQKAESYLLQPTGSPEAWPGLVGTFVGTDDGKFQDSNGGWSAYTDSFYEYLIKMYLYDSEAFGEYKERWIKAADSTIEHLSSHPTTREGLTFLSLYNAQTTIPASSHLASFAGGNFILGGILLDEQKYIDYGIKLAESYYETYKQAASGIGPEGFRWVDAAKPDGEQPPADQADFYDEAGFWATSKPYILRPETMESIYYAYRVTGDRKYQDIAWEAFGHMKKVAKAGSAFASVRDVTKADGGGNIDEMQSFWLAETLKYLYLIFAEESEVQVQAHGKNKFVYNTEAHPVHVR